MTLMIKVYGSADESSRERYKTLTSISFGLRRTTTHGVESRLLENWLTDFPKFLVDDPLMQANL